MSCMLGTCNDVCVMYDSYDVLEADQCCCTMSLKWSYLWKIIVLLTCPCLTRTFNKPFFPLSIAEEKQYIYINNRFWVLGCWDQTSFWFFHLVWRYLYYKACIGIQNTVSFVWQYLYYNAGFGRNLSFVCKQGTHHQIWSYCTCGDLCK